MCPDYFIIIKFLFLINFFGLEIKCFQYAIDSQHFRGIEIYL